MSPEKYCYHYPRPAVTADVLVLAGTPGDGQILLIRRLHPPFKDMWALPGGFIEMEEDLHVSAARELAEETGLKNLSLKQFGAYGAVNRDPRHRTITVAYLAHLERPLTVLGGDDAGEAAWFPVNELPALAFDHDKIINDGLLALSNGLFQD